MMWVAALVGIALAAMPLLSLTPIGPGPARLLEGVCRPIVQGAFALAAIAGGLIALVQLGSLVTRNIFAVNYIWLQESALYLFGAMFLLSAGGVLLLDEHVRVDVFYGRATPRRKALIDLCGLYLFLMPVCALIVWAAAPYVGQSWSRLEGSAEETGIQAVFLLKSLIPTFAVLLFMAALVRATTLVQALKGARAFPYPDATDGQEGGHNAG